jgi:hypothetical protein
MNLIFEIAVYSAGSIVFAVMAYVALSFYFTNQKLATSVLELSAKLEALQERAKLLMEQHESKNIEQTDAFVRFVSQSRDKAFEYIEDVQKSLYKLKVAKEVFSIENPKSDDLEILRNAVDVVLSHLPEETVND